MRRASPTCDIIEHPLVGGLLQFLTWKFDGELGDVALTFSDSTATKAGTNVLAASVDIFSTIPSDMFIPGFSNFWKEQFLEFLVEAEPSGLFSNPGIIGSFSVTSETAIHLVFMPDKGQDGEGEQENPNIRFLPEEEEDEEDPHEGLVDLEGEDAPLNTITITIELNAPQRAII